MKPTAIKKQNKQILPSGSRLWTPTRLDHLIAWHSVRRFENVAADSTQEFWYDTVNVSSNTLRQTEPGKQPTAKVSSDFGNLKVLEFDGGTDFMVKSPPPDPLDIDGS